MAKWGNLGHNMDLYQEYQVPLKYALNTSEIGIILSFVYFVTFTTYLIDNI